MLPPVVCLLIPRLPATLCDLPVGLVGECGRELVLWSREAWVAASKAPPSLVFGFGVLGAGFGFGLGLSVSVFWPLKARVAPFNAAFEAALALGLAMEEISTQDSWELPTSAKREWMAGREVQTLFTSFIFALTVELGELAQLPLHPGASRCRQLPGIM